MEFWIARDKCNILNGYKSEPIRDENFGCFSSTDGEDIEITMFAEDWFPEITWENSPQKAEIKLITNGRE